LCNADTSSGVFVAPDEVKANGALRFARMCKPSGPTRHEAPRAALAERRYVDSVFDAVFDELKAEHRTVGLLLARSELHRAHPDLLSKRGNYDKVHALILIIAHACASWRGGPIAVTSTAMAATKANRQPT
jgi:hypothetical protein